jgi:hypothetical protein
VETWSARRCGAWASGTGTLAANPASEAAAVTSSSLQSPISSSLGRLS